MANGAQEYARHFETAVLPKLSALHGFRGAFVMLNDSRDVVEIEDLTLWQSLKSVHTFAGINTEAAVVEEVASTMLLGYDTTVTHRTVAVAAISQDSI